MNDHQLDALIASAREETPEPKLDALWDGIVTARMNARRPRHIPWSVGFAAAAVMLLSFSLGRWTASPGSRLAPTKQTAAATVPPEAAAASELLGETAVLLSAFPAEQDRGRAGHAFTAQAGDLLVTTRVLLDSRVAREDVALRTLLEDLELLLAQISRLRSDESASELQLIADAVRQQSIVPRIRSVTVGLGAD